MLDGWAFRPCPHSVHKTADDETGPRTNSRSLVPPGPQRPCFANADWASAALPLSLDVGGAFTRSEGSIWNVPLARSLRGPHVEDRPVGRGRVAGGQRLGRPGNGFLDAQRESRPTLLARLLDELLKARAVCAFTCRHHEVLPPFRPGSRAKMLIAVPSDGMSPFGGLPASSCFVGT